MARLGLAGLGRARLTVLEREVAHEGGAIDRHQVDHEPRRLVVDRLEHEGAVDAHRPGRIDHDARAALHHQAVAERLDQAFRARAGAGGKLEGDLRQVHHHAIRIGEREGRHLDGAAEIHDQPGAVGVAAKAGIGRDREQIGRNRHRRAHQVGALGRDAFMLDALLRAGADRPKASTANRNPQPAGTP